MKAYIQVLAFLVIAVQLGCTLETDPGFNGKAAVAPVPYSGDVTQTPAPNVKPIPSVSPSVPPVAKPVVGTGNGPILPPFESVGLPLSDASVLSQVLADTNKLLSANASKTRYFSLQVVNNVGASSTDLETQRQAFKKVINSLSTQGAIVIPEAIDSSKLIYRLNLDDIGMSPAEFDKVIADHYPFNGIFIDDGTSDGIGNQINDDSIRRRLLTSAAIIRMDWFNATATLPILYKKFMRYPNSLAAFEQQFLGGSRLANIQADDVIRIGFDDPQVAQSSRILEHHDGNNGGFYVTYDFLQAKQGQIFTAPLGPRGANARIAALEFQEDLRSVLFSLRNGLYGSFIADIRGQALDKAPLNILRQLNGPPDFSLALVNGQSSITLNQAGIADHTDIMLSAISTNRQLFNNTDLARINTIYQPQAFAEEVSRDNANYTAAMSRMGISTTGPDPVDASYRFYTRPLDLTDVATESGLAERDLRIALLDPEFSGTLNSLNNLGGTISRAVFQSVYPSLIAKFRTQFQRDAPDQADFVVTADCMANSATSMDTCIIQ